MGLLAFLLICVVVGFLVWLAVRFVPMPPEFKTTLPIIAIVVLIAVLLIYMFGGGVGDVQIPRVR